MWASMRGRLTVVKVLCEAVANTELRDKKKTTALRLDCYGSSNLFAPT